MLRYNMISELLYTALWRAEYGELIVEITVSGPGRKCGPTV